MASAGKKVKELVAELKALRDEVAGGTFSPSTPEVQRPCVDPNSSESRKRVRCSGSGARQPKRDALAKVETGSVAVLSETASSSIWEEGEISMEVDLRALGEHDWTHYLDEVKKWSLRSASLAGFYRVQRTEIVTLRLEKEQMASALAEERSRIDALEGKLFQMEAAKLASEAKAESIASQVEELKEKAMVSEKLEAELRKLVEGLKSYAAFQDEVRDLEDKWLRDLRDKWTSVEVSFPNVVTRLDKRGIRISSTKFEKLLKQEKD